MKSGRGSRFPHICCIRAHVNPVVALIARKLLKNCHTLKPPLKRSAMPNAW